jgi:hypothetical protein
MPNLPVDFSEKAKIPPAVGGVGYPYRISAKDLMQDLVFAALDVDTTAHSSGLSLSESKTTGQGGHAGRKISLTGTITIESLLPAGVQGNILYHNGTAWIALANPSGSTTSVLAHDGTSAFWLETTECD